MKKLLSILAGLAISASSASAVVACSEPGTTGSINNNQTPNSPANNPDSGSSDDDTPAGHAGIPNPSTETPQQREKRELLADETSMKPLAKKAILEDQFGIDGNYLNGKDRLNITDNGNVVTNGLNNNDIYGNNDGNALINYLGTLKNSDGSDMIPSGTLGTIKTVLGLIGPSIKSNGIPNPSDMGSMLDTVLSLAGSYLKGIYSSVDGKDHKGVAKLEDTMNNKVFTKQIVNIINTVVNHGTVMGQGELAKYANLNLGDSLKSIAIGGAYLLAIATNDNDHAAEFADMSQAYQSPFMIHGIESQNDISDDAIDYIANTLVDIINKNTKLDVKALLNSIENDKTTLDNLSDIVQLLTLYITSFDKYQWTSYDFDKGTIDNNHAFALNGNAVKNIDAINDVRSETIGQLLDNGKTKFNPLGLIKDLTYYLGDLDQADGEYRIQALLLMLVGDQDYSNQDFEFTLDSGKMAVSDKATPLVSIAVKFINKFMKDNQDIADLYAKKLPAAAAAALYIPAGFKTFNTVGDVLKWLGFSKDQLDGAIGNNLYAFLQTLAWNRGFGLSGTGLSLVDSGSSSNLAISAVLGILDFNGLDSWKEWSSIKSKGILDYFYNDSNIWVTLHDLGDGLQPTIDKLGVAGININLNSMIDSALEPILGQVSEVRDGTDVSKEEFGLTSNLGKLAETAKRITFEKGDKKTVINLDKYGSDPDDSDLKLTTSHSLDGTENYQKPTIDSVFAAPDGKGNSTVNISASHIYNGAKSNKNSLTRQDVTSGNTTDTFVNSIKIYDKNGKKLDYDVVGTPSKSDSTDKDTQDVKLSVTVKAAPNEIGKVTGLTDWWQGYWLESHWGVFGDTYTAHEVYKEGNISNDVINAPIEQDDLNLYSNNKTMDAAFSGSIDTAQGVLYGLSTFTLPVSGEDALIKDKANVKIYKDDEVNTNLLSWLQASADSLTFSRSQIANHALSWVLQLFAIPYFDQQNGYLGMPIASKFINSHLGQAIVEIGNLIGDTDPSKYGIDVSQYKDLLDSIIGTGNNDNVVKQLFDALNPDTKGDLTSNIENFLGMHSGHVYDKHKLLGALIEAFQPSLNDPNNRFIQGYGDAPTTDAWEKLTNSKDGIIFKLWNEANFSTLSDEQWNAISDDKNFGDPKLLSNLAAKNGDVNSATWTMTYKFSYTLHYKKSVDTGTKDADGNEVYTTADVYKRVPIDQTYTISMTTDKDGKVTYTISK